MLYLLYRAILDLLNRTLVGSIRGVLIDFRGLPAGIRILAALGYLVVLILISATLFFELVGTRLSGIAFTISEGQYNIPPGVLVVTSLAFVLGWAFVMTGASDFRRRVFFPIVLMYVFQLFMFISVFGGEGDMGALVMFCFAFIILVGTLGLHLVIRSVKFWQRYPLVEFIVWLGVTLFYIAMLWAFAKSQAAVAQGLEGTLSLLSLLAMVFWVMLSLDTVELSLQIARAIVRRLGSRVSDRVLSAVTICLLLVRPIVILIVIVVTVDGFWLVDWINSVPLILAMIALAVLGRWKREYVMTLLILSIASPVFTLGVSLAFKGHDFTELVLASTGIFPPVLLFVALLAYNVLTLGTRFANGDGIWMPRTGRVLAYLGAVMLVLCYVIFDVNRRLPTTNAPDESVQTAINSILALSILFLGPFYFLRVIWKQRFNLLAEETSTPASLPSPS